MPVQPVWKLEMQSSGRLSPNSEAYFYTSAQLGAILTTLLQFHEKFGISKKSHPLMELLLFLIFDVQPL